MKKKVVITAASRTAVGGYLGSLKTVEPKLLASHVIQESAKRSGIGVDALDQVVMGEVYGLTPNIARVAGLLAGIKIETPAFTVDRQCASSLQAVVSAAQEIQCDDSDIVMAGGVESMSRYAFYLPASTRYEAPKGTFKVLDTFTTGVSLVQPPELYPGLNMGLTAENVAEKYDISRQAQDEFSLHSQQKWKEAHDAGKFKDEIAPYEVQLKKGSVVFDTDEHPRPQNTMEILAKLKPSFKKEGGTVTPGNSSGMNDGASAVVLMSEDKAKELGKKPLANIVSYSYVGCDPAIMGIGPAPAIRKALDIAGLKLEDIDLYELNEAFAAQSIGVLRELGMDVGTPLYDRVNVNGGAIAHGHALGNSGTRLLTTLIYEMRRRGSKYGCVSLCIGGGQGMALIIENPDA